MKRGSSKPQQIDGPNGLAIKSDNLRFFRAPIPQTVRPAYAPSGITLPGALARADSFSVRLGGSLAQVPVVEQAILEGSGTLAIAFDANQDKAIDSFFLSNYTLAFPSITAFGLHVDNAKVTLKDLSNHPTLLQSQGEAVGSWLGSIALSGSKVSFSALPDLRLVPAAQGSDAFNAVYDLATADLSARLGEVGYKAPQLDVSLFDSALALSNSNKDVVIKGKGLFSLSGLGITGLAGDLDLRVADAKLDRIRASVNAIAPIGALGIAGSLIFDHNVPTNSGELRVVNASLAGIGVNGSLRYSSSGNSQTDIITGQLIFDNSTARQSLGFGLTSAEPFPFAIVPLSGQIDYAYRPLGSEQPGGKLNFTDVRFDVITGETTALFRGNLGLVIDGAGKFSVQDMNLSLLESAILSSESFGTLRIGPSPSGQPATFSLKRFELGNGTLSELLPQFSGQLTYVFPGLGGEVSTTGLLYEPVPDSGDPPYWDWVAKDVNIVIPFG